VERFLDRLRRVLRWLHEEMDARSMTLSELHSLHSGKEHPGREAVC
jgi:hypothetical protein